MSRFSAFLLTLCLAPITSHAGIIWAESSDGDLAPTVGLAAATNLGALGPGTYDIIATLDGGATGSVGTDEQDSITFQALGDWTMDIVSVAGVPLVTALFDNADGLDMFSAPATGPAADIYGGARVADFWSIAFIPLGNTGRIAYTARINVAGVPVPEPAVFGMLLSGLLGVFLIRRRSGTA